MSKHDGARSPEIEQACLSKSAPSAITGALSAYVHIPFCSYKCDFCDFTAFAGLAEQAERYCQIVCREIADRLEKLAGKRLINSIFYGGGTPGLIEPDLIAQIQSSLAKNAQILAGAEITLETTPHAITLEKVLKWKELGINRLSIGVQSLNDAELKTIGRDHTRKQALRGLELALAGGFENISCDLMYGLPTQTAETWRSTLTDLLSFPLKHLSAYGLQLANSSPLLSRFPRESPAFPNEEIFRQMYHDLLDLSCKASLRQYEISNFSLPGFESSHNLSYWSNNEYLAFGVGAHRYMNGIRSSNWRSFKRYTSEWLGDETKETISPAVRLREAIFLALRTRRGIDLAEFSRKYETDVEKQFHEQIKRLSAGGFLEKHDGRLTLSQEGILVSNLVMSEFM